MRVLLVTVLRWLLRHLLSLVLIIAVLLLGRVGWVEWRAWQALRAESAQLSDSYRIINASLQKLTLEINARAVRLQTATLAALEQRITAVDSDIAQKRLERRPFAGLVRPVCLADWCDVPSTCMSGRSILEPWSDPGSSILRSDRRRPVTWLTDPSRRVPPHLVVLVRHPK